LENFTKVGGKLKYFLEILNNYCSLNFFTGNGENAVMVQIWIALITILMLKALKAMAKFNWSLSNLVAFIRLYLFVKINLQQWLDKTFNEHDDPPQEFLQGVLF
jgi:hypothetical protein